MPHALAGMSQGRTFRLVLVRDRATLQRLAPAVCELAGMYGGVVVLGEEQGEQLMRSVLDMPADYTGHVESNKWEVGCRNLPLETHFGIAHTHCSVMTLTPAWQGLPHLRGNWWCIVASFLGTHRVP